MKRTAVATAVLLAVAASLLAGCGGGGSSSSGSSSTGNSPSEREPPGVNPGGPMKEATAPNAPAGSKVASCGGGGATALRAIAIDCGTARATMKRWQGKSGCGLAAGDSRKACSLGRWRCQAIVADRGTVVSCARPDGGDVSFVEKR
jgi:hypothetical protein